jgi:serine protease Do
MRRLNGMIQALLPGLVDIRQNHKGSTPSLQKMTTAQKKTNKSLLNVRSAQRSRLYHLLIFGGAAIILVLGSIWRGGAREESAQNSEMSAIEALRKEVSGVQSVLMRSELESIRDALKEIPSRVAPSVVALKPSDESFRPLRNVFVYGMPGNSAMDVPPPPRPVMSGLIADRDGYIITSANIVYYPAPIQAVLETSVRTATVVSVDVINRIALLKLQDLSPGLVPANMDNVVELKAGEWLVREGRATSGQGTRSLHQLESLHTGSSGETIGLLGTQGSSYMDGAILIDTAGRIAGMYVQPSDSFGFVIPIRRVLDVASRLKKNPAIALRGWTGLQLQELSADLKAYFETPGGVLISFVEPDSPAAKAGLKPADLIETINDMEVPSADAAMRVIGENAPGTRLVLGIRRNSRPYQIELTISELAGTDTTAETVQPSLQLQLGTPADQKEGVTILSIQPQAAANRLGIQSGDVILSIEGTRLRNSEQFWLLQRRVPEGKSQLWGIRRNGKQFFIAIKERVSRP